MQASWAQRISIALFFLLSVIPLLAGAGYALAYSLGWTGRVQSSTSAWAEVISSPGWWRSLGFSLYIAIVSIGIATGLALGILRMLSRRNTLPAPGLWLYMPLAIPAMVMALLSFQALGQSGLLSRLAFQMGLITSLQAFPGWVQDPWAVGIIATHVAMATPFLALLFIQIAHREQLSELATLARSLGASDSQIRWRIRLPILLRRAAPTLVLYVIFVLGSYEIPLLLGPSSPQMVAVHIIDQLQGFDLTAKPQAYALAILYAAMVLLLVIVSLRRRPPV